MSELIHKEKQLNYKRQFQNFFIVNIKSTFFPTFSKFKKSILFVCLYEIFYVHVLILYLSYIRISKTILGTSSEYRN